MRGLPRVEVREVIVGAGTDLTPTNSAILASSFETGRVNQPIFLRNTTALESEFGVIDYNNIENFGYGKLAAKVWLDGGNGVWVVRNSFFNQEKVTRQASFTIPNPNYVAPNDEVTQLTINISNGTTTDTVTVPITPDLNSPTISLDLENLSTKVNAPTSIVSVSGLNSEGNGILDSRLAIKSTKQVYAVDAAFTGTTATISNPNYIDPSLLQTKTIVNDRAALPSGLQQIDIPSPMFSDSAAYITLTNPQYDTNPDANNVVLIDQQTPLGNPDCDYYAYGAIDPNTMAPVYATNTVGDSLTGLPTSDTPNTANDVEQDTTTITSPYDSFFLTSALPGMNINTSVSQIKGNSSEVNTDIQSFAEGLNATTPVMIFAAAAPGNLGNSLQVSLSPFSRFNRFGEDQPGLIDNLLIQIQQVTDNYTPGSNPPDVSSIEAWLENNPMVAPLMVTLTVSQIVNNAPQQLFSINGTFDNTVTSPIDGSDLSLRSQLMNRQLIIEGAVPTLTQMLRWIVIRNYFSGTNFAFTSDGTDIGLPIVMDINWQRKIAGIGYVVQPANKSTDNGTIGNKAAIYNLADGNFKVNDSDGDPIYAPRIFTNNSKNYFLLYDFASGEYGYAGPVPSDGSLLDLPIVFPADMEQATFIDVGNGTALRIGESIIRDSGWTSSNGFFQKVIWETGTRRAATSITNFSSSFMLNQGNTHLMSNVSDGWRFLTDKTQYPARIALLPTANNGAKLNATGTILAARQDVLFIAQTGNLRQTQTQDVQTIINAESYAYNNSFICTSVDWINYTTPLGKIILVPACLNIMAAMSRLLRSNLWFRAPAGELNGSTLGRGILRLTPAELGDLYDNSLNPIYRNFIWGQKTLERANTVVSRITGRMTVNEAKRIIEVVMQPYLFNERNTEVTRTRVINDLSVAFGPMMAVGAAQVEVICDETLNTPDVIDTQTLKLVVKLTVINPIEYVDATVVALTVKAGQTLEISEVTG